MDYRFLGRTGLRVSPLCLGTMNFGPETDEVTSHQIMDSALDAGINFFDTANVYGATETEQIIGRWFAQGGGRRDKVVLATKVYGGRDPWPNTSRLSALHIRQACEDSLRRLQTDHIDLYQMHHVDRDTPGTRSGRRWTSWSPRARCCTSAAPTSPAGISCRPTRRPGAAARSASSPSRASTTCAPARSSWRCSRPPRRTASASSRGARWAAASSVVRSRRSTEGRRGAERVTKAGRAQPRSARGVGRPVRRAGRGASRRGAGVAAAPAGGHRPDHRAPHRASSSPAPSGRSTITLEQDTLDAPRQDLPRPRRGRPGGVRLVAPAPAPPATVSPFSRRSGASSRESRRRRCPARR